MADETHRVGIIGGAGKMGRLFQAIFERRGYEVHISDLGVGLYPRDLLERCKVILIAVPMEVFSDVVREIAPLVKEHHWVMDICSLKTEPSKIMKKYLRKGELLATHPLFGPFEESLKNKTIAVWPLRGKKFYSWFRAIMEDEGLKVVEISPRRHDQVMGIVQVINHLWLILLAKTISDTKIELKELVELSTPSFLTQLRALSRLSRQEGELYAKIQLSNPYGQRYRRLLCRNCSALIRALRRGDQEAEIVFKEYFRLTRDLAQELERLFSEDVEEKTRASNYHA